MKRKIGWELFEEPKEEIVLLENINEYEEDSFDIDQQESMMNSINPMDILSLNSKIYTPFGQYDKNNPFNPYKMFECWIGHTNFAITDEVFNTLDNKIEGIGALKVLSKYRFFIGIEKMFSFPFVRSSIQKELCGNLDFEDITPNDPDSAFNQAIHKINDAYLSIKTANKWAIFIGNDGTITTLDHNDFENDEEYQMNLNKLKLCKDGNIITCDNT